jgi:MFS family permease
MQMQTEESPFAQASRTKKRLTLAGIYVAALITRFISASMFTVLPMAAQDIGGMDIYPLASTLGGLLSIIAMPLYGYLGSRDPSKKRPLLMGSLTMGAAALLVQAIAPNMPVIIVAGFFYGVVSASIFVVAFSLIRDMYDTKQAGIYLGFIGTVTSIGMLVGPLLAGLIIDNFGWRFIYHIGWPLLLIAVLIIASGVRITRGDAAGLRKGYSSFDLPGAVTVSLFLLGLILSLSLGSSYLPFGGLANNGLLVLSAASLAALVLIIHRKQDAAIIPTIVLKDRNTMVLALCNLLCTFSTMALTYFMPSYIINVLHGTALQASLSTVVYAVLGIFVCPYLGRIIARAGTARGIFTVGTIVRVIIAFGIAFVLSPKTSIWLIYALMLVAGFYSAQQNVTFSTAPQIQVRSDIRFASNSVIQTAQNLGSSIGMAIYTFLMAVFGIADGLPIALILAGSVAVVALIVGQFMQKTTE